MYSDPKSKDGNGWQRRRAFSGTGVTLAFRRAFSYGFV
jgi:hypothetical protein